MSNWLLQSSIQFRMTNGNHPLQIETMSSDLTRTPQKKGRTRPKSSVDEGVPSGKELHISLLVLKEQWLNLNFEHCVN